MTAMIDRCYIVAVSLSGLDGLPSETCAKLWMAACALYQYGKLWEFIDNIDDDGTINALGKVYTQDSDTAEFTSDSLVNDVRKIANVSIDVTWRSMAVINAMRPFYETHHRRG